MNEHKAETGSEIREQSLSEVSDVDSWVKQANRIKDIPTNYKIYNWDTMYNTGNIVNNIIINVCDA